MNEQEIEQIREWVQLHYLIKEAVLAIDELRNSRYSLKGFIESGTKQFGQRIRAKMLKIEKDLRAAGTHVWIEDTGEEIIFVCTSKNGVKGRNGIKRGVLKEDMEKRLDTLLKELSDSQVDRPYKVPDIRGDPYAGTYKK